MNAPCYLVDGRSDFTDARARVERPTIADAIESSMRIMARSEITEVWITYLDEHGQAEVIAAWIWSRHDAEWKTRKHPVQPADASI